MARIIALDIGKKRTGVAVSDPMQIIATGLETVETGVLIGFLKKYIAAEEVETVLVGYPLNLDDSPTDATPIVEKFILKFGNVFPNMPVIKCDERMTSKMAAREISGMGLNKKAREQKGLLDQVSAVMMLQEYMERHPD